MRAGSSTWMQVVGLLVALGGCGGDDKRSGNGKPEDGAVSAESRCETICARSAAAACENDSKNCPEQCASLSAETPARCTSQLAAFTRCAAAATFICDLEGESHAPACDPQLDAWVTCVEPEGADGDVADALDGGTRDASRTRSAPDASSVECPLEEVENVCSTCLKFSCCDEISACGPACQALVACVNACPPADSTDACGHACIERHPDGASAFSSFAQCIGVQCEAACSIGAGDASGAPGDGTPRAPGDCLPWGSVPEGHCDPDDSRPHAWECSEPPPGCVPSPSGVRDIYCCG